MSTDIPLRCACGAVRGTAHGLSPATGLRFVCYCTDCQTYAHHLGRAEAMLDPNGGTEVLQTVPRRVTLEVGQEHVRCLRQSPKGALRWYAACCRTAIANGMENPAIPFVSLVQPILDCPDREGVLGPIRSALMPEAAHRAPPYPKAGLSDLLLLGWRMARSYLRGEQLPSPFFGEDGRHPMEVEQMPLEVRNRLKAHVRSLS